MSVLTLQSTNPIEDAGVLCELLNFARKGNSRCYEEGKLCPLFLAHEDGSLMIIVPSESCSTPLVHCLSSQVYLRELAMAMNQTNGSKFSLSIQLMKNDDFYIGVLILPSRAQILLVTVEILKSPPSLHEIGEWLSYPKKTSGSGVLNYSDRSLPSALPSAGSAANLPKFQSLQAALLDSDGNQHPTFAFNAREPVDFDTELFKGKFLCVLRPDNPSIDDPYWNERIFAHKKRRLVINLQGKFKYQPTGVVYAGAEISKPMKLGLVTRALAGVLLKLVDRFISGVHSAFGDEKELAHIVAPAWGFFERLVVTPPGGTPPRLDQDIVETAESMANRKNARSSSNWNTVDTYTFSFYSMNIDLPTWSLVGLPVSNDVSLTTFWGDSALKICMYEKLGTEKQHRANQKRYVFALQVKYLGHNARESETEKEEDILRWSDRDYSSPDNLTDSRLRASESQVFDVSMNDDEDESDLETLFYDAEQSGAFFDLDQSPHMPSQANEILIAIDKYCPAWVEVISSRGGYKKAFAVNLNGATMLRSIDDCDELLAGSKAVAFAGKLFSSRLSSTERMRRMVGWALVDPHLIGVRQSNLVVFQQRRRLFVNGFSRDGPPNVNEKVRALARLSGFVFRAMSDRHWTQEFVTLTSRAIYFYHPDKKKPSFHISLSSIMEMTRLPAEDCPTISNSFVLTIRTLGRSVYIMFGSEEDRERFLAESLKLKIVEGDTSELAVSVCSESTTASRLSLLDNPADEFMQKSSMWNCQRRRILNSGKLTFRQPSIPSDPLQLVEDALRQALEPVNKADEVEQRRAFLDSAAMVKQADVRDLPHKQRMVFFLNLYHLMIMHAYLVLGPPDWSLKWLTYFNSIAYEVSDDIFSLVELEHCILRNRMNQPSQFMSRFVIPRSEYSMAISIKDFRINFALNCGSLSNPKYIFVYQVENLDEQLDAACRLSLKSVSIIRKNGRKLIVELPRVCEWYFDDFGNSEQDLLRLIEPFLSQAHQDLLRSCRSRPSDPSSLDMGLISIRYQSYSYECRPLRLASNW